MMNVEESLKHVKTIFVEVPKRYGTATDHLKRVNDEIQDIMHVIELGKVDAVLMSRLSKEIKALRKRRRELKNELEVLEIVKEFISWTKPDEKSIGIVQRDVRAKLNAQGKRTYSMRVRRDLQELIK